MKTNFTPGGSRRIIIALLLLLQIQTTFAQVSGTVFKDFNFNGTQQTSGFPTEPGMYGVTVRAYNSANVLLATKTTDVAGAYNFTAGEIPSGTAVRIEFIAAGVFNGKSGTANGTDIQFITAPSTTTNYAVASQDWYSSTANPYVAATGYTNGNAAGGGTAGANNNLYLFPYDMGNGTPNDGGATRRLPNSQLGSVFGLAVQRTSRTLFMAAYLKRHAGFGPNGIGAIYKTTIGATGVPSAATLLVDVNTIGLNVGTDPRTVTLPSASNTRNADVGVFAQVGKRGIGGIDVSEDGADLYFVNMFQKRLQRINIGNPLKASLTAADVTGDWAITDPGIAGTVWHPMACKSANGKIYVGGVAVRETSATHNLATDTVGARGIVYEFNPVTQTFTEVLRFPFSYRRGFSNGDYRYPTKNNWWCAWQNNGNGGAADPIRADYNTANGTFTGGVYYPQPMISSIEFDVDGSMILGIRDRFGDQMGYQNLSDDGLPTGTGFAGANNFFRGLTSGELLRAGKNASGISFTIENRGQVTTNGVTTGTLDQAAGGNPAISGNWSPTASGSPFGGRYGPGWGGTAGTIPGGGPNPGTQGAYFYFNHNFSTTGTPGTLNSSGSGAINAHYVKSNGGVALLAGSNEVIHTLMDPIAATFTNGAIKMFNSGASAGNMSQRLQLVATTTGTPGDPTNSGKSNGMGDVEIITDYQPVEIGNRIWNDANGNGFQDAGEAGINGVTVELVSPGPDGNFGTGDDVVVASVATATVNGQPGSYFFSTLTVNDARKPASWTGLANNAILPGFNYMVRIANATGGSQQAALAGLQPTRSNAGANGFDNIDNDGTLSGTALSVVFSSFNTSHSFDFGFKASASLGDRVWRDDDLDGAQDAGEPGVAGITVTLFSGATVVGSTVTDAYGYYLFDNLAAGTYTAGFTLPANYRFTTQTNTVDNTDGTALRTEGSDVVVTTGRTYTITLSAGENERNIDAGVVFAQPATASVGDRVWVDTDNDGVQDAGETGISGVTVTLLDGGGNVLATTVTDANGNYLFTGLAAGTYAVRFTLPTGFIFSTKDAGGNDNTDSDVNTSGLSFGRTDNFTLLAGQNKLDVDAGLVTASAANCSLGDRVWNDLNQNGIQDAGEPGVGNVTVNLYFDANADGVISGAESTTPVATTTTDAFGYYIFNNLSAGKYQVGIVTPGGFTITLQDQGADNTKDSDFNTGTGRSNIVTLPNAARNLTVDAGIYQTAPAGTARLGDYVWYDANANGTQDAGEQPVAGVTATLYTNGVDGVPGTADDVVTATTATDINGYYQFVNLAAGNYNVGFSNLPAGYSFTPVWASNDANATNSDANPGTGRTGTINLTAGESEQDVDAGLVKGVASGLGSLGNKVWYDLDADGLQDANEAGVPNVTVTLFKDLNGDGDFNDAGENTFATTTTNALGEYLFSGLTAGTYQVQFSTLPAGFAATTQNQTAGGGNDYIDSDGGIIGGGTSTTGTYQLAAGEDNLTVDLGLTEPTTTNRLGNYVWFDLDSDGVQDAGEPGVAGVTVLLYRDANNDNDLLDAGESTPVGVTTTNANGLYLFAGLVDGNYAVQFTNLPAGFSYTGKDATTEALGTDSDPNLFSGFSDFADLDRTGVSATRVEDLRIDGGIVSNRAVLGNYVWYDTNGDGVQQSTELGVPGVTVTLYRPGVGLDGIGGNGDDALPVASMITGQDGQYLFGNLEAGTYQVHFGTLPSGVGFTIQNTPGDNGNNTNSDATPATGLTSTIVLTAGEADLSIDAGVFSPRAVIGNFVWADANGNGIQESIELGVPGILVTLYDNLNNPVSTAITDAGGFYLFPSVAPGTYTIGFSNLPTGATFTIQDQTSGGGNDNNDSDPNTGTGRTASFVVTATTNNLTFDAGILNIQVLPVPFTSISAEKISNTAALVKWTIGQQQNGLTFIVERSVNGVNFTAIGNVSGTTATAYSFTDNQPVLNGKNYYRIRQVDVSGRETYTEIRWVKFGSDVKMEVYPNPATNYVNIIVSDMGNTSKLWAELFTMNGQKILTQKLDNGINQVNVSPVAAGTYQFRIVSGNETIETKTIIIH